VSDLGQFELSPPLISTSSPSQGEFSMPNTTYAAVIASISLLSLFQRNLLYGTSQINALSHDPEQLGFAYTSACVADSPADCKTWMNGFMQQGLAPTVIKYMTDARTLLDSIKAGQAANKFSTYASLNATLATPIMQFIRAFERSYAPPVMLASSKQYAKSDQVEVDSIQPARLAVLILYVLCTIALFFFFYQPLVWKLNEETRRICSMLLMFPVEVLETLAKVKDFQLQLSSIIASADDYS
jgi:hypothetical protein